MTTLTALLLSSARHTVDELRSAWERGEAVIVLDARLPEPAVRAALDATRPHRLHTDHGVQQLEGASPVDDDLALVALTSGTTGEPRAVELSQDAVRAAAVLTSRRLGVDPASDTWLACLPLAHVGGLGVVTRALHTDTPLVVHERAEPAAIEEAARAGATLVSLVPTVLRRCDTSGYRAVLLGGAAAPASLPSNVVTTWGMTETFGGVVYDGRPLDDVSIAVEAGELLVRSPTLARRWRDGTAVAASDGWLHTGDAADLLPDGRIEVHGRLAEVIATGGEMVWPARVETVLATHPGVAEVIVVARPDAEWGQRVHAVVVPSDPSSTPTLDALREHVAATLPRWCAPRSLEVVSALEHLRSGKVNRGRYRARR